MPKDAVSRFDEEQLLERIRSAEAEALRLEEELARAQELASLGVLTASVAHEVRNLLTPVMSRAARLAKSSSGSGGKREGFEEIVSACARADAFVELVLATARGKAGGRTEDVRAVAEEVAGVLASMGAERSRIEVEIPAGVRVEIDDCALRHVLLNLSINALESAEGACRVRMAIERSTWNTPSVRIVVRDEGPGFPQDMIGADAARPFASRRGLGLVICQLLISHADGSIKWENRPGEGASVVVTLPAPAET